MYVCMYVYICYVMYVHMYVTYIHTCMYIYVHLCMYVCSYVCVHIYAYICSQSLCCKMGTEFAAYYEAVENHPDELEK